jgi:hypothetical protein
MPTSYTSDIPFVTDRIHAAAVYCSDGRWGEAFDDFLTNGLGLPRYDRVALPGGPACLADHPEAHHEEQSVLHELKFLVDAHELDRVVLIQHQACAFYSHLLEAPIERMESLQRADLVRAVFNIRKAIGVERIEAYIAKQENGVVRFEPVDVE